jgi:hypothetical protein
MPELNNKGPSKRGAAPLFFFPPPSFGKGRGTQGDGFLREKGMGPTPLDRSKIPYKSPLFLSKDMVVL